MQDYNYNPDDRECYDKIYSGFCSENLDSIRIFSRNESERPRIKKITFSKHIRNSGFFNSEVLNMLLEATCPICKQHPKPDDTLLYVDPYNGQISWFCDTCSKYKFGLRKYDKWHLLPGYHRKSSTKYTEDLLLECIRDNNGHNINQLKDILNWSYGKTRGACYRLQKKGLVRIENVNVNCYRESKVFAIYPDLN
jgi:hypothetical protein